MIVVSANVVNSTYTTFQTKRAQIGQVFANVETQTVNNFIMSKSVTPSSNNVENYPINLFFHDSNFLYLVTANNVIKRAALLTF